MNMGRPAIASRHARSVGYAVTRMSLRHISCFSALALLLPVSVALAGPFFDVPDDHPYDQALNDLK